MCLLFYALKVAFDTSSALLNLGVFSSRCSVGSQGLTWSHNVSRVTRLQLVFNKSEKPILDSGLAFFFSFFFLCVCVCVICQPVVNRIHAVNVGKLVFIPYRFRFWKVKLNGKLTDLTLKTDLP